MDRTIIRFTSTKTVQISKQQANLLTHPTCLLTKSNKQRKLQFRLNALIQKQTWNLNVQFRLLVFHVGALRYLVAGSGWPLLLWVPVKGFNLRCYNIIIGIYSN